MGNDQFVLDIHCTLNLRFEQLQEVIEDLRVPVYPSPTVFISSLAQNKATLLSMCKCPLNLHFGRLQKIIGILMVFQSHFSLKLCFKDHWLGKWATSTSKHNVLLIYSSEDFRSRFNGVIFHSILRFKHHWLKKWPLCTRCIGRSRCYFG